MQLRFGPRVRPAWSREASASEPLQKRRNRIAMSKPGADPTPGISSEDVLIPTERHPACRRREARPGSGMERENLAGDAKGKGASGSNREAESTDAPERGGLPRSSDEGPVIGLERRGGSSPLIWANWFAGRSPSFSGRRQPSRDGTSRMSREAQVRICERLGVKLPGPTRQQDPARLPPAHRALHHGAH